MLNTKPMALPMMIRVQPCGVVSTSLQESRERGRHVGSEDRLVERLRDAEPDQKDRQKQEPKQNDRPDGGRA